MKKPESDRKQNTLPAAEQAAGFAGKRFSSNPKEGVVYWKVEYGEEDYYGIFVCPGETPDSWFE